jgi:hypothetical protein
MFKRIAVAVALLVLTTSALQAQEIKPVKAKEIEPFKARELTPEPARPSATPGKPTAAPGQPHPGTPIPCPASKAGNLVEPLSNGMLLTMTKGDILQRFGEPTERGWDARTFGYDDFGVSVGGSREEIWHFTIKRDICLNSGVTIGSSRAEVAKAFGRADRVDYKQYRLEFSYADERVSQIKIDPVESFKPYPQFIEGATPAKGSTTNPTPTPRSILGTWYGSNVAAQIEIRSNGTYTSPNGGGGKWTMKGNEIRFTGSLEGWNNGQAKLVDGNIEFYWKNASGQTNYFVLIRR